MATTTRLRLSFVAALALSLGSAIDPSLAAEPGALTLRLKASEAKNETMSAEVSLYASSHALVIGIDSYDEWPRRKAAVTGGRLVAEALREHGFQVSVATDLGASDLKAAFENFFAGPGAEATARLVVWFAGHVETEADEGYLVAADAPLAGARLRTSSLSLRRLEEHAYVAAARHLLVVVDAPLVGVILQSRRPAPPRALTVEVAEPARQFLFSATRQQQADDDTRFAEIVAAALRGAPGADANGDGYLTATELARFADERTTDASDGRQTPRMATLWNDPFAGDVVFALAPKTQARRFLAQTTEAVEAEALAAALKDFRPQVSRLNALAGRVFLVVVETARPDSEMVAIMGRIAGVKSVEVDATVTQQGPAR